MKKITVKSPNGKGKFNLRTIEIGTVCGSRAGDKMYNGTTDKGRAVWCLMFDDNTVGIKDNDGDVWSAGSRGWKNIYNII